MKQFAETYAQPSLFNITMLLGLVGVLAVSLGYKLITTILDSSFTPNEFNRELLDENQCRRVVELYNKFQDLFQLDYANQDLLGRNLISLMKSCVDSNKRGVDFHLEEFKKRHNKTYKKAHDSPEVQELRKFLDNSVLSGIKLFSKWANRNPNFKLLKKDPQESLHTRKY